MAEEDKVSPKEAASNVLVLELDEAVEERIVNVLEKVLTLPKYRGLRERITQKVMADKAMEDLEAAKEQLIRKHMYDQQMVAYHQNKRELLNSFISSYASQDYNAYSGTASNAPDKPPAAETTNTFRSLINKLMR